MSVYYMDIKMNKSVSQSTKFYLCRCGTTTSNYIGKTKGPFHSPAPASGMQCLCLHLLIHLSHKYLFYFKNWCPGTSLAVRWLRLCVSNAGGTGSIPDWGTKIPQAVRCGGKKKSWCPVWFYLSNCVCVCVCVCELS